MACTQIVKVVINLARDTPNTGIHIEKGIRSASIFRYYEKGYSTDKATVSLHALSVENIFVRHGG
jgi:hypothetical protein